MSSIGSGPGPGAGSPLEVNPTRPVGAVAGVQTGGGSIPSDLSSVAAAAGTPAQAGMVATSVASAGNPPVDGDRVAAIRKAIEHGAYPLVPTKISDAMIAAGMVLRIPR